MNLLRFTFVASFLVFSGISTAREVKTVDQYLRTKGFYLKPTHGYNEGYMTTEQKNQFIKELSSYSQIKNILEIGLNGGHSAEVLINHCPNLEKFFSIDINHHKYAIHAAQYFQEKFPQIFNFIPGDSTVQVPLLTQSFPQVLFDLIYIDGNHAYNYCLNDIRNCQKVAHSQTILWIDDYIYEDVKRAVDECVELGIIKLEKVNYTSNRAWVKAKYIF